MKKQSVSQLIRLLLVTCAIGILAGLAATAFQFCVKGILSRQLDWLTAMPWWLFFLAGAGCLGLGGLVAGLLMWKFAPDTAGSGIPQVKTAYHRDETEFSWNTLWVKFVGGVLSIGTGSSLGREGPTIHIAAAIASRLAIFTREDRAARSSAVCAGSAAGLAAAFNSPLAGVTLVLEEIASGKDEEKFAGRSLLAAALAVSVTYLFLGDFASLPVNMTAHLSATALWMSPVVALLAGAAGLAFQRFTLSLRKYCKTSRIPAWARPALGAAASAFFCVGAYLLTGNAGVFGLGEHSVVSALNIQIAWYAAGVLLVAKLAATILCYGSGGCGGIFAPILFFGAMSGSFLTGLLREPVGLSDADCVLLNIAAMTACLAAVVRAPITSILIVIEMTRQVYVLPALMVAAVVGVYMNRFAFRSNFYDEALEQDGIRIKE